MHRIFVLVIGWLITFPLYAQYGAAIHLTVLTDQNKPRPLTTIELVEKGIGIAVQNKITDSLGKADFNNIKEGNYFFRLSCSGFTNVTGEPFHLSDTGNLFLSITLHSANDILSNVTVTAVKSFTELHPGKTIINVDASITATGTNVLEALEKIPGIAVDKDGNISLKGKTGVLVMIDNRPVNLTSSQLATLLSGMNSSSISQIEILAQPPSRYDAAGNAGAINIKTKKNLQKGFNGSATVAYIQGKYARSNNNLQLNYRNGKWNCFANYSMIASTNFTNAYVWRTYYNTGGNISSILEQPSFLKILSHSHNLREGIDYYLTNKTTLSADFSAYLLNRDNLSFDPATWMNAQKEKDSTLFTYGTNHVRWRNAAGNISFRHSFTPSSELTADAELIRYSIHSDQLVENFLTSPGRDSDTTLGWIPSDIHIFSAKADYFKELKNLKLSSGIKTSHISTDNLASYEINYGTQWQPDYDKSNHFLYNEYIQSAYINGKLDQNKWTTEGGIRLEATSYNAHQLGNPLQKDSSFSRNYKNLFPSITASYKVDSSNAFSISAGRRIDRPAFQKLNPFVIILNKYAYQKGNPYYQPQYTWKAELSHTYKNKLITSIGYSLTSNYFSQIFLDSGGIVTYTEGNLGKLRQYTFSESAQLSPAPWWSLSCTGVVTYKQMQGVIGTLLRSHITQFNLSFNNQLHFKKTWSGELTGSYTSRSQNDVQEFLDPSGTLSVGLAKTVMKNKGVIKLAVRDIFYSNWIKGNTYFFQTTEYFKLSIDSRAAVISFVYRFGKNFRTPKYSEGSAKEELQRINAD